MLSDSKIIEAMRSGDLMLLDPATGDSVDLRPEQLQPVSVDLRPGAVADQGQRGPTPARGVEDLCSRS